MLTLKKCPKCGGNIYLSSDYYGRYEQCLQCGHTYDLENSVDDKQKVIQLKEKPAVA
jgi:hypothetical protein